MHWFRRGESKRDLPDFLKVPWKVRDLIVFILAWIGIQLGVIFALGALSAFSPGIAAFLEAAKNGDIWASFSLNLLDAGIGIGLVSLYLHRYNEGWEAVGWRRVSFWRSLVYLIGILVVFIVSANILLNIVGALVPSFDPNQAQENEFVGAAQSHHNLALIALVLLPAVLEETIFRGFLFPALAGKWGVIWGAVLSSAIFGLAHFQANISIYTFLLGLLLCFMYVRLRSIVPGIFLHMLNNYLAFMALTSK